MILLETYNRFIKFLLETFLGVNYLRSWLKDLREKQTMTQEIVAKNAEISRSFYTHIEKGEKDPSVKTAKAIANTLGFKWELFFDK